MTGACRKRIVGKRSRSYREFAMVMEAVFEPPDLLVATVTGMMTPQDQAGLVAWIRDTIQTRGAVRVLIVLDHFTGWSPIGTVDNARLWLRDDEAVVRMAIVGEPKWKLPMLTLTAQPLRRMPIEYFDRQAPARAWLAAGVKRPSKARTA
jgi:hypothetical protein